MEKKIRQAVSGALDKIDGSARIEFTVERSELVHGDYATNVALVAAKQLQKDPRQLAGLLTPSISDALGDAVEKVEVAGQGFINLTLSRATIELSISEAGAQGERWGTNENRAGELVNIEYSNPNPFKEMHIGHLMSNVVGESFSRLIENEGAEVVRDTFGGDVGPHVAKALWALHRQGVTEIESTTQIGEAYAEGSNAYEEDTQAKAEIDALNTRIYDIVARQNETLPADDSALLTLWRAGREISMDGFRILFKRLGTKPDYEFFDSDTTVPGLRVVEDGLSKGVFEKSDGAIIYRGEKRGLHTLVFVTSRGTPTYETKDLGLAFLREERVNPGSVIIVTGAEQVGHFKVFLAALEDIAPRLAEKTSHAPHGLLSLTSGKMSSRKGNVITANDLIIDMIAKASEKNSDPLVAEQVAIGAIKYMILRQAPGSNIIFDPEKSLSLDGDSGPYLQYSLVRAKKILAYANGEGGAEVPSTPYAVERIILHYPEIVARAARELAPNLLTSYLTELAAAWNSFYATEHILGSSEEMYKQRVARAFAQTMENGLHCLGIPAPERM